MGSRDGLAPGSPRQGNGPGHREIGLEDPDGYAVVVAGADGEAYEPDVG